MYCSECGAKNKKTDAFCVYILVCYFINSYFSYPGLFRNIL